ncbi:MAG: RMD1 family protein [Candidatus Marinarcus sp.]|uniref:RMD1 family protein n=1 Tax=Candidatus Marinarcus sp. TaxID=3100987 RepID=UPI003AFFAC98
MTTNILFVSVEIPVKITRQELEEEFPGLVLTTIEKSLMGEISNNKYIFASSFGIITFCNFSHEEIKSFLSRLDIKEADSYMTALINQDYPMIVDEQYEKPLIDEHTIKYNKFNKSVASIISLALSQSVGLEISEKSLEQKMIESKAIYDKIEKLKIKDRSSLMSFASSIAKERFDILNKLYLLDKPDILWDDLELESLYNQLGMQLELKSRFEVVEYKMSYLKESIDFATDRVNQKSSEFLEWIIIWLIVIEVFFSIYDYIIKPNL